MSSVDFGKVVRKAFFDALNGNVTIEGAKIPVVDEKLDQNITEQDLYILFGVQTETPGNVKSYWVKETDIQILIVNRRKSTVTKTVIENIANQINAIVFPTRTTFGISVSAPFNLSLVKDVTANYTFTATADGFDIMKAFVFKTRITHD